MTPRLYNGRVELPSENMEGTTFREQSSIKVNVGRLLLAVPRIVFPLILALITAAAAKARDVVKTFGDENASFADVESCWLIRGCHEPGAMRPAFSSSLERGLLLIL